MAVNYVTRADTQAVTTTNDTVTTVLTFAMPNNSAANFRVQVTAMRQSNNVSKAWQAGFLVKRDGSGTPQVVGSLIHLLSPQGDVGALLWDISADGSGGDVRIRVKGAVSASVDWYADAFGLQIEQ